VDVREKGREENKLITVRGISTSVFSYSSESDFPPFDLCVIKGFVQLLV
jgi:hypothetical protein